MVKPTKSETEKLVISTQKREGKKRINEKKKSKKEIISILKLNGCTRYISLNPW